MPGTAGTTARIRALALAAVVVAVAAGPLPSSAPRAAAAPLAGGSDFTITSTISTSATSAAGPALLYPGVTRYLWYTVSNPLPQPITVTSLGIANADAPAACPLANLDLGDPTFTGTLVVPARSTRTVPAPRPILLKDLPVNQDACKKVTFRFTYTGTGWYSDAKPPAVTKVSTRTILATAGKPVSQRDPLTLTATVTPTATSLTASAAGGTSAAGGSVLPAGTVSFYRGTPAGAHTLLGASPLGSGARAKLVVRSLPGGSVSLYAVYQGTAAFAGSTSPVTTQTVIAPPAQCTGTYTTLIVGSPSAPAITGTRGSDFIYAVGGNYTVRAGKGNDCVVVGDGTNVVHDGSGADVVIAGNGRNSVTLTGSRNVLLVGDGSGNRVSLRGSKRSGGTARRTYDNVITMGNGVGNRVTVRKGSRTQVTIGDGAANRVYLRRGSRNVFTIGDGALNRVTVRTGYRNRIVIGDGSANRVYLRKGSRNAFTLGDGALNRVTVRTGYRSRVVIGDGDRNRVVVKGRKSVVSVGSGTRNRLTLRAAGRSRVLVGDGTGNRVRATGPKVRITLGSGRQNRVTVRRASSTRGTCSLPAPPPWWTWSPARYYRDTIIRCRVVTR